MVILRDYQVAIVDEVCGLISSGAQKNAILIAGCGTGKSLMSATIAKRMIEQGKRVLFVCDLRVLPTQMLNEAKGAGLDHVGLYCAGHAYDNSAPFVIAMSQTMLSRFKKQTPGEIFGKVDVIIFDEAHQSRYSAAAKQLMGWYTKAFDLGLTATPTRSKNTEYLGQFYDYKVMAPQYAQMVELGAVLPERVFCPSIICDETQLDIKGGEYSDESAAKQTNTRASIEAVIDGYFDHCLGTPFAAYCVNLEHARLLTEAFNDRLKTTKGYEHYDVEYQSGSTTPDERKTILFKVKVGKTLGICSVGTMAVGFDLPAIGCILWCRPTLSEALWFQSVGRGCRILKGEHSRHPSGKLFYVILDFAGSVHKFGMPSDHRLFDIGPRPPIDPPGPKNCPACGAIVSRLETVCPVCGHVFEPPDPGLPSVDVPEEKYIELTEIFTGKSKKERKFLRSAVALAYKNGADPLSANAEFYVKFKYAPPESWFKFLLYGERPTVEQQMQYWSYLSNVETITSLTVRSLMFSREFGFRFLLDPYEILGVKEGENVPKAYQRRLSSVQDAESLSIVKTAYQIIMRELGK